MAIVLINGISDLIPACPKYSSKQYKTNLDINWKPTNKVSMVLVLEKPFSLQQLHGTINLKTPVKGFES
jgi:hypothetical protein